MSRSLRVSSKYIANKEKLRFRPEHWEIPSVAEKGWQQRKQSTNQPKLHKSLQCSGCVFCGQSYKTLNLRRHTKSPAEATLQKEIDIGVVASLVNHANTASQQKMTLDFPWHLKCKASHCQNLEIGTLGKAPPCCSRTRHKFEATKCQSHHTWLVCLPNSLSETSSHLIMMSRTSWVSHSKSPMMYPRCPESRNKKEDYSSFHCHNISLFLHQAPFEHPFCLTKHLPNHA